MTGSLSRSLPHSAPGPASPGTWRWAAAGLLLGSVLALWVNAPARWLAPVVTQWSGGRLQLAESEGTLWEGSARLMLTGGTGSRDQASLPGRVGWTVRWSWPSGGPGLGVALALPCCAPQGLQWTVQPHWQGASVRLQAAQSRWPLAVLAGLGTPWNSVQAEGQAVLQHEDLQWDVNLQRWQLQGRAQLDVQDLASRLSTLRPLGSYRLQFQGGEQPRLELQTLSGALQLSGQGQWQGGRLRFEGEARAEPAHAAELSNLLNILGRRQGERSIIQLG